MSEERRRELAQIEEPDCGVFACSPEIYEQMKMKEDEVEELVNKIMPKYTFRIYDVKRKQHLTTNKNIHGLWHNESACKGVITREIQHRRDCPTKADFIIEKYRLVFEPALLELDYEQMTGACNDLTRIRSKATSPFHSMTDKEELDAYRAVAILIDEIRTNKMKKFLNDIHENDTQKG